MDDFSAAMSAFVISLTDIIVKYKWVILFYVAVLFVVYLSRKKFEKQGFIYLYKTKVGLRQMDYFSNKFRELIKLAAISGIGFAFLGLIAMIVLLLKQLYDLLFTDSTLGASPLIPGVPIAGTGLVFPLIIGWICLFLIIIVHEFSHGVVARAYGNHVKSSGIVFIGPILGAFVEPDEKQLGKKPDIEQYAVFAAGPISNLVFAGAAILILSLLISPIITSLSTEDGIRVGVQKDYPAMLSGLPDKSVIIAINATRIHNFSEFYEISRNLKPGDIAILSTEESDYHIQSIADPKNESRGYMGITINGDVRKPKPGISVIYHALSWLGDLFFWIFFISFNVGLINLLPIYITDGARMLKVALEKTIVNKTLSRRYWIAINNFCGFIILLIVIIPLLKFAFN